MKVSSENKKDNNEETGGIMIEGFQRDSHCALGCP